MATTEDPVELDLDALEREGRPVPMKFTVRGKAFLTADPVMLPWSKYESINWTDTEQILGVLLSLKDYETFVALDISQNQMNILATKLSEHYFGGSPGESEDSPTS